MGIIEKIFSSFREKKPELVNQEKLFIVDAKGLGEARKDQKLAPRDQIDILQKLSQISASEGIAIHAFLEGESLRKVAHGGKFDDITVYFVAEEKLLPDAIVKHLKECGSNKDVIVITSNRILEERLQSDGTDTMRISTFKKAFDKTAGSRKRRRTQRSRGGRGEGGRGEGGRGGGGSSESGESGGGKPNGNRRPAAKKDRNGNSGKKEDGQDGVSALIDLLE